MGEVPAGLVGSGAKFWEEVTGIYKLRPDERRVLEDACRTMCLIDRLEDSVASADMYVTGSMGQEVINPLFTELRQQRAAYAKLVAQLKLPEAGNVGVQGARPASTAAEAARKLAEARWGTRG